MVDVRIPADRPAISARRTGLDDCTIDDLRALAAGDASSGYTECGPVAIDADGSAHGHGLRGTPAATA